MTANSASNGDAFLVHVQDAINALQGLELLSYYQQPLPSATDHTLRNIVERYMRLGDTDRVRFLESLTDAQRALFGIFGHRAATISLRQEDPSWLQPGLVGTLMANFSPTARRPVEPALAVFYYSARELDLDPEIVFERAKIYATDDLADVLTEFGRKSEITLRHYGWKVVRTPDGVLFRNEWR